MTDIEKLNKPYSVGIVGLGNIGLMYDYQSTDPDIYLTHAKSFYHHPKFNLEYVIDIDDNKLRLAEHKYKNLKAFNSIYDIERLPEIVVLASSPAINFDIFNKLKDNDDVKIFLVEKPFLKGDIDFKKYEQYANKCFVNYIRKYTPFFRELKQQIESDTFGNPIAVHVWYSKGIRNNGSHMIDLINYFFNHNYCIDSLKIINTINDYSSVDLSCSFSLNYKYKDQEFTVIFQAADERCFSLIELDLIFQKQRYRIYDFGNKVDIYTIQPDKLFPNYSNLAYSDSKNINLNNYGYEMCNYLYGILNKNEPNISGLKEEYSNNKIIELVNKSHNHE